MANIYLHLIPQAMQAALSAIEVDEKTGEISAGLEGFEQIEMAAADKIAATALFLKDLDDDIDDLSVAIAALQKRKKAITAKADRIKELLLPALHAVGGKVRTPYVTVGLGHSQRVAIDEDALSHNWCAVKYVPEKDRIKKALKDGQEIEGASLVASEHVTIRI